MNLLAVLSVETWRIGNGSQKVECDVELPEVVTASDVRSAKVNREKVDNPPKFLRVHTTPSLIVRYPGYCTVEFHGFAGSRTRQVTSDNSATTSDAI
jgi:hypothetical protein